MEKKKQFIINTVYWVIITIIALAILHFSFTYLTPFILGFLVAFILKPIISKLKSKFGAHKWIAGLVVLLFYMVVGFILFWIFVGIWAGVQNIAGLIPDFYNDILKPMGNDLFLSLESLNNTLDPSLNSVMETIQSSINNSFRALFNGISSGLMNMFQLSLAAIPSFLLMLLTAVISSIFFVLDYQEIVNNMINVLPNKTVALLFDIKQYLKTVLGKYIRTYAILMSLTFIELFAGLSLIGIPNALGIAFLVSIVDILPILGTGTVMIPWIIIEVVQGDVNVALMLLVLYVIITVIRNIIEPKIIGDQFGLHPLVALICIYVGAQLFGVVGLFGLPILVTMIKSLYDDGKINIPFLKKNKDVKE